MKIALVKGIQILDSRGNPTLRVKVTLEDGSSGVFEVPSGASTGIHEAHELRDGLEAYHGKGVSRALRNVDLIHEQVVGKEFTQASFDEFLNSLDGTENKELLGANAILGASVAFAKASAKSEFMSLHEYLHRIIYNKKLSLKKNQEVPKIHPFANVINGGLHAGNDLQVQEFMLIPHFESFEESTQAIAEVYADLKVLISKKYGKSSTAVGDEGGFAPSISTPEEALDLLVEAVKISGYEGKISFAIDAAASDFYDEKKKTYEIIKGTFYDYKELSEYYSSLVKKYPLISIEDPFAEDDFEAFSYFMKNPPALANKNPLTGRRNPLVVGDDLLVTNPKRISIAQNKGLCSSLLLKINQVGSLSESIEAYALAQKSGWHVIVSHRSGETTDSFIADLAYAMSSSIKLGAPCRGERVVKYNRLLDIYSK